MAGKITVTGSGGISTGSGGDLSSWSVNEAITPVAIGQATASTGNLSFTGARDETDGNFSEWAVDNDALFSHEDDGAGELGGLAGNIKSVNTQGGSVSGSMVTLLNLLSAEKTMPTQGTFTQYAGTPTLLRANGTSYQNQLQIPLNMAFDSSGNFFLTEYSTGRVIKFSPTGAYLAATSSDIPGSGYGSGNGQFSSSAPTYAIAIDSSNRVYVTDPGNNRVQRFTNALVYDAQFGTFGTGDGQFSAPTGIAINNATGKIFVVDSLNLRVQRFSATHTFEAKWGTSGTGNGQFTTPRDIALDSVGNPYVTDWSSTFGGSVQKFNASGVFGFRALLETNVLTDFPYGISMDNLDRYYITVVNSSNVQRYLSDGTFDGGWGSFGAGSGNLLGPRDTVYTPTGLIYVSDGANGRIIAFTPAASTFTQPLSTYFQQYVDLCITGHSIDYQATNDPDVLYPGWTDSVWTKLNELCAATGTELAIVAGVITIRDVGGAELDPELFTDGSISVDSTGLALAVDIVYQNVDYGDGVTMYDARLDDNRVFSIAAGRSETFSVVTDSYPVVVNNPSPTDAIQIASGQYHVIGSDNLPVVSAQWVAYGGSVTVEIGDNPNVLDITLTGPSIEIPGVPGPYFLATSDGDTSYATLNISGSGVSTRPQTLHLYTGANPVLVTQDVQTTITNVHITDEASAYDRGVWASDLACGPNVTLTGTLALESVDGFGLTAGAILPYADSRYRILTSAITNSSMSITATRHVTAGDEAELWGNLPVITNLAQNPSFETNLTGFTASSNTTLTRSTTWASSGTASMRISTTSNSGRALIGNASTGGSGGSIPWALQPGSTYTLSSVLHSVQPGGGAWNPSAGVIEITYGDSVNNNIALIASSALPFPTTDSEVSLTFTVPAEAEGLQIGFYATGIGTNWFTYWDSIVLTEGTVPWNFFDGSFSGASWAGTANLSASSKSPDTAGDYAAYWNGEPAKNAIIRPLRSPED